jgi:hypothetical protein
LKSCVDAIFNYSLLFEMKQVKIAKRMLGHNLVFTETSSSALINQKAQIF